MALRKHLHPCEPWGSHGRVKPATLLLLALVLVVHGFSLGGEFLAFDDAIHLSNNPWFNPPSVQTLVRAWSAPLEGLYAPLSYSLWWVLAELSYAFHATLEPAWFHAANIGLHIVCTLLVQQLLLQRGASARGACLGALFFGCHPLTVESVAWISELRGLLATALGLACLYWRERRWLALGLFALALLAKPAAIACLPLVLLWDGRPWREKALRYVPWALLALACVLLAKQFQPDARQEYLPSSVERAWISMDALGSYTQNLLVPLDLCADPARSPARVLAERDWAVLLLAPLLAFALLVWDREPKRVGFALANSGCALLPVLGWVSFGFQNTSTVADRYAYLALLGPALWIAQRQHPRAQLAIVLSLIACAVLSIRQSLYWRNDQVLFERVLQVQPASGLAHNNLGLVALRAGQIPAAEQHYRRALELNPKDTLARGNLGLAQFQLGAHAAGLDNLRLALEAEPDYLRARLNLAAGLAQLGRMEAALAQAQEACRRHPQSAEACVFLARLHAARGETQAARELAGRALQLLPNYGPARELLASLGGS